MHAESRQHSQGGLGPLLYKERTDPQLQGWETLAGHGFVATHACVASSYGVGRITLSLEPKALQRRRGDTILCLFCVNLCGTGRDFMA